MIRNILFDVDGVFLSEEHYFDASALTVWELLMSRHYLGLGREEQFQTVYTREQIASIRSKVFLNDQILNELKSRGMNANWDMIYVTFSVELIYLITQLPEPARIQASSLLQQPINRITLDKFRQLFDNYPVQPDFQAVPDAFSNSAAKKQEIIYYLNDVAACRLDVETSVFHPKSSLWEIGEHCSQEWYVGDQHVEQSTGEPPVQTGKSGFLNQEKALIDSHSVEMMFRLFRSQGLTVGIATGRPALETYEPFRQLGWLDTLDRNHMATADDVLAAEKKYDAAPLAKPHPFTYLLAWHGHAGDIRRLTRRIPEKLSEGRETLIVGDSLADLLCAKQIGCRFAGVLTGLSGRRARAGLQAEGADYILNSIADLPDLIEKLNRSAG